MMRYTLLDGFTFLVLLGVLVAQDDDEQSVVQSSQDFYVAFDQTSGNTNKSVS